MNHRDAILAELRTLYYAKGPKNFAAADTLRCFSPDDDRFLVALNQLLAERKVIGIEAPDGRMGVALNPSEHADAGAAVQNIVTMNLGDGASITGPFAVGQTITQSYAAAASAPTDELRQHLENLVVAVGKLVEETQSVDDTHDIAANLETFVQQANKEVPSRRLLKVTGEGLIEAAKTVASMAEPITKSVKAVLALLG